VWTVICVWPIFIIPFPLDASTVLFGPVVEEIHPVRCGRWYTNVVVVPLEMVSFRKELMVMSVVHERVYKRTSYTSYWTYR